MHVPDGWREAKVADIAHIQVGRDLNESAYSKIKTDEYRFPVYSNTVENRGLYGYYNFEEYSGNSVTIVGRGIGLGTAFSRKKGCGFGAIGRLLVVNPTHNSFDVDFFANYVNFQLRIFNESGGIPQLPGSQIAKYHVVLPPLPEQQKIAQILSTWDKAIEKLESLISAKQKRKKALMQQLLTGKKRFAGFIKSEEKWETKFGTIPIDWKYLHIGEVARQLSLKNNESKDLQVLSCTKHYGLVDSLSYFGKRIFSEDTSTYKVVPRNAFAYATNHIDEGSIGYQNICDEALISPMYTVFQTENSINDNFLYRLLKTELYRHIFEVNTSASVDRRGSLRWSQFAHIKIPIPSLPEQQKIASVLSVADKEIETHQNQLSALKQQKKGLMQQLLTGKKRVKIDEPVQLAAAGA